MDDVAFVRAATPFVGRSAQLERLQQLIGAAAQGTAAAVLVGGDAGVGKTSLVAELSRRAADEGVLVLLGRCVDLGTGALPYLPFAEAFTSLVREHPAAADLVREAAAVRPALARISGAQPTRPEDGREEGSGFDRLALFEAVTEVLARLGDEIAPVLLVLEDLHWADPSSRDLVRFLLTRLGSARLLVIGTYRADDLHRRHPLRPLVAELQRLPGVERLDLLPFSDGELETFLRTVAAGSGAGDGAVGNDLIARIAARSGGNAYFAEELLDASAADELPAGLSDVLLDRLERLSPAAQRVVRAASVLGAARIEDRRLRAVAADPAARGGEDDFEVAVREAVAHQVLVGDGPDRYAFRHALLQEAVYADLLPGERTRLHRAAADHLRAEPDAAAELARHSLAAHDLPGALQAFLAAAEEAGRRSAPAQALADYEQVLQLWDAVPSERRPAGADPVTIGIAAAMAAGDSGLDHRGYALARAALERAGREQPTDPERVARARVALGSRTYYLDRAVEARDLARQVIADLAGRPDPSPARARARVLEVRVDVALDDAESALALIPEALAEVRAVGLAGSAAELLAMQAIAEGMIGRDTRERWAQARRAAEEAGDLEVAMRVVYNTAIDRIDAGDLKGGLDALAESLGLAEEAGLTASLYAAQAHWQTIYARWLLGDAEGALAVAEGAAARRLPGPVVRQLRYFVLPILAARDPQGVLASSDELASGAPWENQVLQTARAEALAWLGRGEEAAAAARSAIAFLDEVNDPYQLAGIAIDTTAVAALADVATANPGRRDDGSAGRVRALAVPFLTDARERARLGRPRRFTLGPEGLAWLARLDAEEARLEGRDSAAAWRKVAEAFDGVSAYEHARARWRAAAALLAEDDRDGARAEAAAAREAAARLGVTPLVAALDDLGRRARLDLGGDTGPGGGPGGGPGVLTPREADVMRLVAQGLTNRAIGERLFISEKTVSVHVSNVLAKIGASGRAEAVAILARGLT